LRNSRVARGTPPPDYCGPALEAHHVEDLKLEGFVGMAARPGQGTDTIVD